MKRLDDAQRQRARELRRGRTDAEARLWQRLRNRGLAGAKFRRQVPLGPFVVDFCCQEVGLIVDVDGGQHAERQREDAERTRRLEASGFRVLRFWNNDVLGQTESVLEKIQSTIEAIRAKKNGPGEQG